ncbi:hypothetical protein DL766_005229 [Monosporascus sp. MC13-8B]|uniref:Beta-galactosidase n=1 Tax=Monosporascus cannonballus TaxID=155416 RepID=A0ABY0GUJ8_9PEZI|nr:hypothetical protein DL762_010359 [Monosporascus cannonballus]RYO89575.1 hypothetical protein DL763_005603 [Monosporascus cannonballus]RYP29738.1 hypothetical protein DL766_005229 [Monosporascus sp. MC13-8B]
MKSLKRLAAVAISLSCINVSALTLGGRSYRVDDVEKGELLQDLVTWDEHSLFVRGERIFFYSGEFHPWRLPVPGLWLDVLQKIKALGYNGVSFYVDWALHEGNPGHFTAEGVFAWEPFFDAAAEAGIYLLARPGPYINAEASGGGFPAWLQRNPAILRTNMTEYLDATENYVAHIGKIIADAQITNGGPVIAFQAENEYTFGTDWVKWPDVKYIDYVNQQFRRAGIVVPFINNEAAIIGLFTPEKPGGPDIYGHDSYPIGWDCANPGNWTPGSMPTNWRDLHLEQSPNTPYSIIEYQGGALDYWGGVGLEGCASRTNHEFERLFYKAVFSFGITVLNIYMTFGGTNWGNLGQPGGYTSYDYGAAIRENRMIDREKYSEAKLIATFVTSSPAYLDATPGALTNTSYVSTPELSTTPVFGKKNTTFYVTRHTAYESLAETLYIFTVPTSVGNVTIPQLGGSLTLNGRDAKIHVTDYDVGGINLIYSSADIYTHSRTGSKRVLLLYGGEGETHELAFSVKLGRPTVEGGSAKVKIEMRGSAVVVQWEVTRQKRVLHYGSNLDVYLLWRNDAFNYWSLELEAPAPVGNYTSGAKERVIAKAGYLLRTAARSGTSLHLTGDLNATAELEIIAGLPGSNNVYFNGEKVRGVKSANGRLSATLPYSPPTIDLPNLADLDWRYLDSLPEINPTYDDAAWTDADTPYTNNTMRDEAGNVFELKTPTTLISSDYGYHAGHLIYRGHFTATGNETSVYLSTQGGGGFGHSAWLNSTYLGSFPGAAGAGSYNQTLSLPTPLKRGARYVLTVVLDHMGTETNWTPGLDLTKTPRGIMDYAVAGHSQNDISWKLTGNLGGEAYRDAARGPLNEGGTFAERQGYHLPAPPTAAAGMEAASPFEGFGGPGIGFYAASFELGMPAGYDVPLSFVFANATAEDGSVSNFRAQLFVNGYQFGKYSPQTRFPVPEGILNYNGTNYLALTLWAQQAGGARLQGLTLEADAVIQSGMKKSSLSPQPAWEERGGAY